MRYTLIFIIFLSCSNGDKQKSTNAAIDSSNKNQVEVTPSSDTDLHLNKLPIDELTIGVISLRESAKGKVNIYDDKRQVWKIFSLSKTIDKGVAPYSVNLDYQNLVFRVVDQSKEFYSVIVNEESGLIKYIKKSDPNFNFETWDKHILKAFSVDFNEGENPIRESPSDTSAKLDYNKDEFYNPIEVKGDWLKVKWGDNDDENYGWIKWKASNKLLVNIFYTA